MQLTKEAALKAVRSSRSFQATRLSPDELPKIRNNRIKEIQQEVEKRVRQNKELTILIVE